MSRAPTVMFERDQLPMPIVYLTKRNLLVGKVKAEFAFINCPAHRPPDRAGSIRVSLISGAFECRVCRTRGFDVIDLHRLLTGAGFLESVTHLLTWEANG